MDFLFVKTKGKTGTFRKVLSDKTIYENIPSFDDNRPYNDELRLCNDQWFVLEQFSQKPYAPQMVTEAFNAAPDQYTGDGMLKAGKITSIIGIILSALYIVYWVIWVAILGTAYASLWSSLM